MQPPRAATWVGKTLPVTLGSRSTSGKVERVEEDGLVVRVAVREAAAPYMEGSLSVQLPDGGRATADLTRGGGVYTELELFLPWPGIAAPASRQAETAEDAEGEGADEPAEQKRQHFRLAIKLAVDLLEETAGGRYQVARTGVTHNLSGGGMLVEFNPALLPGEHVFRVHMGDQQLVVRGRVIRRGAVKQAIVPVEFVGLREIDRTQVIRYIFNKMRNVKELTPAQKALQEANREDEPAYRRRYERFYQPSRVRYHP